MPKAQSEIGFERENTKGYQATVNFHPSFLHGERLLRGLALTSKLVGYNAVETGRFLFAVKRCNQYVFVFYQCGY